MSGGIRLDSDAINGGPRLFLYRQTQPNNIRDWTYLGIILSLKAQLSPSSHWRGAHGINFECGGFFSINQLGRSSSTSHSSDMGGNQLNVFTTGTEGGRNGSHFDYWPLYHAVKFDYNRDDGNVNANIDFSGVLDWGRAYAFFTFEYGDHRQILVGWAYEDDEFNVLTSQRGYQGSFTLFRDVFVQTIGNIQPQLALHEKSPSWTTKNETDGSISVITLGQRVMPETLFAFKESSKISQQPDVTMTIGPPYPTSTPDIKDDDGKKDNFKTLKFDQQPGGRHHAINATLHFDTHHPSKAGFRILAGQNEWTDIYYDSTNEYLKIDRLHSSAIASYGNTTEQAKHRLWPILNLATNQTVLEPLKLLIIVDNSVVEVHANDRTVITTRVYPWYSDSLDIHYLIIESDENQSNQPSSLQNVSKQQEQQKLISTNGNDPSDHEGPSAAGKVQFVGVEVWDGLINAWPDRPVDTSGPGLYSRNISSSLYGLWPDS